MGYVNGLITQGERAMCMSLILIILMVSLFTSQFDVITGEVKQMVSSPILTGIVPTSFDTSFGWDTVVNNSPHS